MTIRDQLAVSMDTSPRRTGMSLYSSGPNDTPVIAASLDIDDTLPGFVSTIHGFRENRTEMGKLLSDPQFAATYAGTVLARLALPQVMVEFGTYFLPAIYPLDQCGVGEDRHAARRRADKYRGHIANMERRRSVGVPQPHQGPSAVARPLALHVASECATPLFGDFHHDNI